MTISTTNFAYERKGDGGSDFDEMESSNLGRKDIFLKNF